MIFDTSPRLKKIPQGNILDTYKPNNTNYLQIIKNFVESGDFEFWVAENDPSFIICHDTTRDSLRIFASNKEALENGLAGLKINTNNSLPIHIRVNENFAQYIQKILEEKGYKVTPYEVFNAWKMIPENIKIPKLKEIIKDVQLGDASLAPLIAADWPYAMWGNVDKLQYFTHVLQKYPSSVLYDEEGKMIAICIRHNGRTGSMTYTHQFHRNKNSAEKVLLHSTTIGEGWTNQYADANVNNVPSNILFKRFGSELVERVAWIHAVKIKANL